MDTLSPSARSSVMSRIKSINTTPELVVRSLLHKLGYRFRVHRKDLPGCPDIILPKYHAAIFVHGCFWHRHDCPKGQRLPKSRIEYWEPKLLGNQQRDIRNQKLLHDLGWKVLVIWECSVKDASDLTLILRNFLSH